MKKLVLMSILVVLMATSAVAVPVILYSPGGASPGYWSYDGAGTFTFP